MHEYRAVILSQATLHDMYEDVYQRQHIEACGVLRGQIDEQGNWLVKHIHPLPNIFESPVYFEFAPEDLLSLELTYPGEIIGVYHSHPTGYGRASSTDQQNMQRVNQEEDIPWAWLIVCGPFHTIPPLPLTLNEKEPALLAYFYAREGLQDIPIKLREDD